jgi:hypothetical protein
MLTVVATMSTVSLAACAGGATPAASRRTQPSTNGLAAAAAGMIDTLYSSDPLGSLQYDPRLRQTHAHRGTGDRHSGALSAVHPGNRTGISRRIQP